MTEYKVGDFVRYSIKNEIGLIGEVTEQGARVWWHLGGTRALSPFHIIVPLSDSEILSKSFSNEYVKESLLERYLRLLEGKDVSDLIDERNIREDVWNKFLKVRKENKSL